MKNAACLLLLGAMIAATPAMQAAQAPLPSPAGGSASRAEALRDPVLGPMLAELERSEERLQLKGFNKPFFIEYRVEGGTNFIAQSEFGALVSDHEAHVRFLAVRVLVGDYKTNNSSAQGKDAWQIAPIDDDPVALRYALWQATDKAYKGALSDYAQKLASLKSVQSPPKADDFSHEKPVISLGPAGKLDFHRSDWIQRIVAGSGQFKTVESRDALQHIEASNGDFEATSVTTYLVNSEGTILRKSSTEYHAAVNATIQAADGMRLRDSYFVTGANAAGLGTAEAFQAGVAAMLRHLSALSQAPVMNEEYHGPVLFSGSASAMAFYDLFSSAVLGQRPSLGSIERTTGPFSSSYQTRVLPENFEMVDDPGLKEFQGTPTLGAYAVDDEGVPAQRVALVDQGELVGYLLGREPIEGFPQSNGHGMARGAMPPRPSIGVLEVKASHGLDQEALRNKLVALGKDQGLKSVYVVETLGGLSRSLQVYRVNVADGSKTPVRGAKLADVDLRAFRAGIAAAGSQPYLLNIYGANPLSIIAPPILLNDVTVERGNATNDRLPYYPPPS